MQKQVQDHSSTKRYVEVNGRQYQHKDDVLVRPLRPNQAPSHDAHVTTPHPDPDRRADGWRLEWIFLLLIAVVGMGVCLATGMLPV